jgi:hypothetical protein
MRRTKQIEIDGVVFVIAPLTVGQVEEFTQSGDEMIGPVFLTSTYNTVVMGLNNVPFDQRTQPDCHIDIDDGWSVESIRKELDLVIVKTLYTEILKFSGLDTEPAGEAKAALSA